MRPRRLGNDGRATATHRVLEELSYEMRRDGICHEVDQALAA
jgi:hypothetical protein